MAEKSFPLNNTDYGAEDAQLYFATRTRGVFAGDHLAVTAGSGMTITLGKGIAWLKNGVFGGLVYGNTAPISLTIGTANATYPRIDRVVIRYDVQTNTVAAYVKSGTPASSPVPPALTRDTLADEISVAQVYVAVAATSISAGNITDERLNEEVCGLMRDGVTGIDTSVIYAQWQELTARLEALMDAQIAGNLQNQINENKAAIDQCLTDLQVVNANFQLTTSEFKTAATNLYYHDFTDSRIKADSLLYIEPEVEDPAYSDEETANFYLADPRIGYQKDGMVRICVKAKKNFLFRLKIVNAVK